MKFLINKFRNVKKQDVIRFAVFIAVIVITFFAANFLKQHPLVGWITLAVELSILAVIVSLMAGYVVLKSFFWVGAGLSLLIYIAEKYCQLPQNVRTGDDALKSLILIGIIYIIISFCYSLYKEISGHLKKLHGTDKEKIPLIIIILFALFVGIFVWQICQVINPIILNFCVYKS